MQGRGECEEKERRDTHVVGGGREGVEDAGWWGGCSNSLTLLLLVDGVLVLPRDLNELGILHDELLLEVAVRAHELDHRGRVLGAERGELDVAGGGGGEHGGGVEGECELVACRLSW